ncbi:hypothetical protein BLNAU_7580 [Blattamonas nauphoetae]|uniref:Uncharacterized protein n=1 Tax=Blattamonas nauphoetae TaxID=2049346 RepID=A0ABQ9Y155_9EUKA|nr:hypothetical protein BLNAU_7580 [Blattamonas nauphoetae]
MQRKQVNSCSIVPLPHSSPIVGVADPWHYAAQTGELLLDRAPPSLIPDRWRRRSLALCSANRCALHISHSFITLSLSYQVNSCSIVPLPHSSPIVGVADPWHYAAQTGELLLDRAPSLTHPRSLASPIPGIMQRKQVNSCSIVPLPHSSPIVGVADPWHYAAQTGELLLDRAPPSLIPDRWRRRSLALCSANR